MVPSAHSALRLRLLYAARLVSVLGTALTTLALPWLVLSTTGSATQTGLVFAAEVLGTAALGLPGGAFVERLGPRRAMLTIDVIAVPILVTIPVAHQAHLLTFPLVLVVAFVLGAAQPAYLAATNVALPMLVGEDERVLTHTNGRLGALTQLGLLAGNALGGVAIALLGPVTVLYLDAVTYAASFVLLLGAIPAGVAKVGAPIGPPQGGESTTHAIDVGDADGTDTGDLAEGLRFLWRHPITRPSLGAIALINVAFQMALVAVPVAVQRSGSDAEWFGWIMACFGAGAVLGGLAVSPLANRIAPTRLVSGGLVVLSPPLLIPALTPTSSALPTVLLVAFFIAGLGNSVVNAPALAVLTAATPAQLRPKVFAAVMTTSTVAMPIGAVAAGLLLDQAGVQLTFGAAAVAIAGAAVWLVPVWWRAPNATIGVPPDDRPGTPGPEPGEPNVLEGRHPS